MSQGSMTTYAPEIVCPKAVWNKLIAYSHCQVKSQGASKKSTKRSFVEISGLGIIEQIDERTFAIRDFLLVPCEGSGGTTSFIDSGTVAVVEELIAAGNSEDVGNLRLWWHTHPKGNLSWSGQDVTTMEDFGEKSNYPWLVSIVTDGSGGYRARLDIFEAMGGLRTYWDNIPITIEDFEVSDLVTELQKEVDEKVTHKTYLVTTRGKRSDLQVAHYGYGYPSDMYSGHNHPQLSRGAASLHHFMRNERNHPTKEEIADIRENFEWDGMIDGNDPEFLERMRDIEIMEESELNADELDMIRKAAKKASSKTN